MKYTDWAKGGEKSEPTVFERHAGTFKEFTPEDKAAYEELRPKVVADDLDVLQQDTTWRQKVQDAPPNVRQRLMKERAARVRVAAEKQKKVDFQAKRMEVKTRYSEEQKDESGFIKAIRFITNKGATMSEMRKTERPEYLIAAQAEEKALEFSAFEEELLTGKGSGVIDTARFGQYNAHKSISLAAAISEGRWDEVDNTHQRLSDMEEAAAATLPQGESWLGKGALGATQSALPMAESIALGAVSFGTLDKVYWTMMGQGEITHTYLSETDKKMADMTPEEQRRLQAISGVAGALYGGTEFIGSMYGAQNASRLLRRKAFGKLTQEAMKNPTIRKKLFQGGAKFVWEWFKENSEEGIQGMIVDMAVQGQDGEVVLLEAMKTGLENFKEAAPATLFMVGGGKVTQKIADTALRAGAPEAVIDRAVKSEVKAANQHLAVATEQTAEELRAEIAETPLLELLDQVREIGLTIETGSREELTQILEANLAELPGYQEKLNQNYTTSLTANKKLTNLQRNEMKWLAQGDILPEQLAQFRTIMERILENSSYEGDLAMFIDERLELAGDSKFMSLKQLMDSTPVPENDSVKYLGVQEMPEGIDDIQYWNLKVDIPGHPAGSTVSEKTVREAGIEIPTGSMGLYQLTGWHGGRGDSVVPGMPISNFDLSYVGTGEGNAVFGHGVYVTQKPGIAKDYAGALDRRDTGIFVAGRKHDHLTYIAKNNPGLSVQELLDAAESIVKSALRQAEIRLSNTKDPKYGSDTYEEDSQTFSDLALSVRNLKKRVADIQEVDASVITKSEGVFAHIYKLTLFPGQEATDYNLLSWYNEVPEDLLSKLTEGGKATTYKVTYWADRDSLKLSDKTFTTEAAANKFASTRPSSNTTLLIPFKGQTLEINRDGVTAGQALYKKLTEALGSKKAASEFLLANGIDGIVYPAQSLGTGNTNLEEGKQNFVIFDDKQVKIEESHAYARALKLEQRGQDYPTGSTPIRGISQITAEGKFVVDLLATGDILTLAHEFAHVVSPYLDNNMLDAVVDTALAENPAANKGLTAAKRTTYKRIWNEFAANPASANVMTPQMQTMLRDLQETLAYNFENYLVTETAPVAELDKVFKTMRDRYASYYRDVRKLPVKYQQVDSILATAFDKLIAKEDALIKPSKREVTLYDEERQTDVTYVLEESRGRNATHRELLRYIARGFAKVEGLHEQLEKYTVSSLDKISPADKNAIALVRNKADAIRYIKTIDMQLAKIQEATRKKTIKKVRKATKRLTNLKTNKGESGVLHEAYAAGEKLLVDIDTGTRTAKRTARAQRLKVAEAIAKETGELPPELRHATDKELKDLANIDKRSIYDMNQSELTTLLTAIEDILAADTERQKNHSKQQLLKDKLINDRVNTEIENNWRWKKRSKKILSTEINNLAERVLKPLNGLTRRQSVNFAAFSSGENSFLYSIFRKLEQGRDLQDLLSKVWMKQRWAIFGETNEKGISEGLRKRVKSSEKITTKLQFESGKEVSVKLTTSELMMIYGYSKNTKLRKGLFKHGLKLEAMPNKLLKFGNEEAIQTLASRLDPEYQRIVDETIDMYQKTIYPILAKTFFQVTGVELKQEDYYLPTFREWHGRGNMEFFDLASLDSNDAAWMRQHIGSLGFLNVRKPGDQAFYIKDFFTAVEENQENSAFYTGMADPIRNLRVQLIASENVEGTAAYNYKIMMGPEYKRFKQWADRIEKRAVQYDDVSSKFAKWSNRGRKGILKASIPISVAQVFSCKGCQNYGTKRTELLAALGKQAFRNPRIIEDLQALDPMFWHRYQHPPMIEMGLTNRQAATRNGWISPKRWTEIAGNVRNWRDLMELAAATEEGMLFTIKYMDAYALTVQWEAIQQQGQRKGWTESATLEHFKKVVRRTQPMQDPLYTSNFLSSEGSFIRLLYGPFRSQRDAYLGEAQLNIMELQNNKAKQGKGTKSRVLLSRMNRALVTASVVFSIAKAAMSLLLQGKDDEDSVTANVLYRTLTNVLALLPIAGDLIVGTLNLTNKGYGGLIPDYIPAQLGERFIVKLKQSVKAFERGEEDKGIRYGLEAGSALATGLGSAWGNITKLFTDYMKKLTRNEGKANGNRLYR